MQLTSLAIASWLASCSGYRDPEKDVPEAASELDLPPKHQSLPRLPVLQPGFGPEQQSNVVGISSHSRKHWSLASSQVSVDFEVWENGAASMALRVAETGEENNLTCTELYFPSLFQIRLKGLTRLLDSGACLLASASPQITRNTLQARYSCPAGELGNDVSIQVDWSVELQDISDLDQELTQAAGSFARIKVSLTGSAEAIPTTLSVLVASESPKPRCSFQLTGSVPGSPVVTADGRIFLSAESPLAHQRIKSGAGFASEIGHLENLHWPPASGSLEYGAVIGAVGDPALLRSAFASYLEAARPRNAWRGPLVHYNSWFDVFSWQDGFMRDQPEIMAELRKDPMDEDTALWVIRQFGQELAEKRSVQIDSFLWDDGWDDKTKLWTFDSAAFPNKFQNLTKVAHQYSCSNGIWLSPWGGYGEARDARLGTAKLLGYETNKAGSSLIA
eukprot:TRINITY_DN15995_c0_g1_i1.p1 TRINITY_DN15995_c0_g1~~TRINITY_DN15995_c0_g1_i1.p1  ORF type:complete len:447 (-),score=87.55 TRINITY_DN15995_c0_g1_i1:59-1399(-)